MSQSILFAAAAGLCALGSVPASAQGQDSGAPRAPSSEGTDNPYAAPRNNVASDPLDLSPADRARKAVRDACNRPTAKQGKRVPAEAADVVAGRDVRHMKGQGIGLVERIEPDGVVVATELGRVKVPLEAFGKDGKGLMLDLIKADFDKLVAEATATS